MEPADTYLPGIRQIFKGIFPRSLALSFLSIVLALGTFAFAVLKREQDMLLRNLEGRAQLLAVSVDRVTGNAIVAEDNWAVVEQFRKMVEASDEVRYAVTVKQSDGATLVFTEDGWRVDLLASGGMGSGPEAAEFWRPESQEASSSIIRSDLVGEDVLHYKYPLFYEGYHWGWIHVGMTLRGHHANRAGVYRIVVMLSIPGVLIGIVLSFLFARRLTRPISLLQEFAGKLASGNLAERVVVHSNDELGDLADSLNLMAEDLGESMQRETELREKEVLLKEIHHRVKNNMQILTSLHRLQARRADSEELKQVLKESESRIRSMGLIHEKLYQSESLSEIEFKNYAGTLTNELMRMYQGTASMVTLDLDMDDIRIGLDTALPCGLILNELVSNSLKYAFPNGREGRVLVKMREGQDEGSYNLIVSDNGIGAPANGELKREGSLGMRLVNLLVEQLNGKVQFLNGNGVTTNIHFYESNYKKRF
jgi:two-component sensor histidine kinase